jgi:AcrR family transcriptional regulator
MSINIFDSFKQLLSKKSIDRITVKEVCEHCGVNRQTFYNNFTDITDVFKYIFFQELNEILEIAFLQLGMNRVWLRVIETNTKAINLYKKVGFVQEGTCRDESLRKGQFVNQIQMSILAKEWIGSQWT